MLRPYKPTIPQSIGEVMDMLGWMMLKSPTFKHEEFPGLNIELVFFELKQGLEIVRGKLGEERYQALMVMSDRMRAHFEADPEDKTDDGLVGRQIIREMEDILKKRPAKA
jgi:hypothetical protein